MLTIYMMHKSIAAQTYDNTPLQCRINIMSILLSKVPINGWLIINKSPSPLLLQGSDNSHSYKDSSAETLAMHYYPWGQGCLLRIHYMTTVITTRLLLMRLVSEQFLNSTSAQKRLFSAIQGVVNEVV